MKKLLAGLLSLLPFISLAADVNETNIPVATYLAPTDYVRVLTNGAGGLANSKTRIAPISLLPSGGGSQVWTNDGLFITPYGTRQSNNALMSISKYGSVFLGSNTWKQINVNDANILYDNFFSLLPTNANGDHFRAYIGGQIKSDISANDSYVDSLTTLWADNQFPFITYDMDAKCTNGTSQSLSLQLDPGNVDLGGILGTRTNGSFTWKVEIVTGRMTASGTMYPSNVATAIFPSASQLGTGGYWIGNSNGVLVSLYSLDGSTTVMKILAP